MDIEDSFFVDSGLKFDGGDAVVITDITSADPPKVTFSTWPTNDDGTKLANGNQIYISGVVGMTELNGNVYTVRNCDTTAKTCTLESI